MASGIRSNIHSLNLNDKTRMIASDKLEWTMGRFLGSHTVRMFKPFLGERIGVMPTYLHLITLTDDGRTAVADGPEPHPVTTAERFGGEILHDYFTLGRFDIVSVSSFPDDTSAARFTLAMDGAGQYQTETVRAFDTDEFRDIILGLDAETV